MANLNILGFPKRVTSLINPVKVTRNTLWRYGSGISQEPHVFVVGAPRSGTTLMFTVLRSHPAFSAIDSETFFFVPRDVFNLNNYKRLSNLGAPSSQETAELLASSKDLINFYDNVAKFINMRDGGKRFLEKTPFHVLYLKFLTKHFPKAKFINMIRDGRDCYISNCRLDPQFHKPLSSFASLWRDSIKSRQSLGEHSQILDIKYEEFTHNPAKMTQKIMNFIDEDFLEQQIDPNYYSKSKIFKGYSGHERLSQPIKPSSIGKWREKLTVKQIEVFNSIAGRELKQLEYEIS